MQGPSGNQLTLHDFHVISGANLYVRINEDDSGIDDDFTSGLGGRHVESGFMGTFLSGGNSSSRAERETVTLVED